MWGLVIAVSVVPVGATFCCFMINSDNKEQLSSRCTTTQWWNDFGFLWWLQLSWHFRSDWSSCTPTDDLLVCCILVSGLFTLLWLWHQICIGVKCNMLHILMSLWHKSILQCCCCLYSPTASQRICLSAVTGPSRCHSSVRRLSKNHQIESICPVCQHFPPLFLCSLHHCFGSFIGQSLFLSSCSSICKLISFFLAAGNPLPSLGFESLLNSLAQCSDRLNLIARVPSLYRVAAAKR